VGFLTEEDLSLTFCPLTGLRIKGHITLETVHGGYILYKFPPVGMAYFEHESLKSLGKLYSSGSVQPLTTWAGLCREAYELGQVAPIIQGQPEDGKNIIPETFEEKRNQFLRLFYEAGGKDYVKRDIFLNNDFTMAFALNVEEFSRIFQSLLDEGLLRYDKPSIQADAVDGRLAHFRGVLLTPAGKQEAKNVLIEYNTALHKVNQSQSLSTNEQIRHLLEHIYNNSPEYRIDNLLAVRDHIIAHTKNANEFELIVDEAQSKGLISWGAKSVISLGRIQYRDVRLTLTGIERVKFSNLMFQNIADCPLTGLPLKGRGKFEPLNGSEEVLYTFKPIGCAIFERDDLIGLLKVTASNNYIPNTDLAAICRESHERGRPVICLTSKMLYNLEGEFPKSFEEKQMHFLRLLFETGGNEYRARDLYIEDDFPLAFAKDSEEFTRILKRLIARGLLQYDNPNDSPNSWPGGIRLNYNNVLLTNEGEQYINKIVVPIPSVSMPSPNVNNTLDKIFISHSSTDRAIVEEVIDLLEVVGVKPGQIFCSSFAGYGIELGEDFLQRIKTELNSNTLVLFVLTDDFYKSTVCVCEMGAAWVTTSKHIPLVVPPLDYKDVKGVIPLTQGFKIDEPLKWNLFKEQLEKLFKIENQASASVWERKRDKAIKNIGSHIKPPEPLIERARVISPNRPKRGGSSSVI
jgi:hypothetical protein